MAPEYDGYTLAGNRRRKGTPAGCAPEPEETRMGGVDIVVLILKLMVSRPSQVRLEPESAELLQDCIK